MGDEADADWDAGLLEAGREYVENDLRDKMFAAGVLRSWYCHQCAVEVYDPRCKHCGKTKRQRR